ncbi:MAG TPA: FAD-dependent oxidoreductase [Candidatus Dormibacteraeota bacterium]
MSSEAATPVGVRPVAGPSHWWDAVGGPPPLRAALDGDLEADVAVVGAGYTGLWAAYELRRAAPELRVVVLEREFAGFGASGRNGGWLSGLLAGSRERYARHGGRSGVIAAQRAMFATVDEVARVCAEEAIDCDLVKGGTLTVATSQLQLARLRAELAAERGWGFGEEDWRLLDAGELAGRVRVGAAQGALFSPHCARVQPARLVLGLGAAVERRGATIFEQTPVLAIAPHRVTTAHGTVRARWVIRATEGYTAGLPGLRRVLVPLNSAMVVTAPLDNRTWAAIGWDGCETMGDSAHLYCYLQRTADGRIAIGGRGRPYRYGSRADHAGEIPSATIAQLRGRLAALFPAAAGVEIERGWAGVLGVPRDWCSAVSVDPASGLCWAGGYVGDGVSTSNLAGRTLRDLILGRDTGLTRLPWVGRRPRRWEPEPLRWLGIEAVFSALRVADRAEARRGRASRLASLADRLSGR